MDDMDRRGLLRAAGLAAAVIGFAGVPAAAASSATVAAGDLLPRRADLAALVGRTVVLRQGPLRSEHRVQGLRDLGGEERFAVLFLRRPGQPPLDEGLAVLRRPAGELHLGLVAVGPAEAGLLELVVLRG